MKNLRELFNLYHAGFQDFGPWLDHHREMHTRHPLDVPEFGAEWLRRWSEVGRLLQRQCTIEWWTYIDKKWLVLFWNGTVSEAVEYIDGQYALDPDDTWGRRMRILLDGTIIREWGPK